MGDQGEIGETEVLDAPKPKGQKAPPSEIPEDGTGCLKDDGISPCPPLPNPTDDDPVVGDGLLNLQIEIATNEALKPVMAEKLAFQQGQPDERKAAYDKVLSDGLSDDYKKADEGFRKLAAELIRAADGKPSQLDAWISKWLGNTNAGIAKLFDEQRQVGLRLFARGGPRECAYRQAEQAARQAKLAYENWKAPGAKIKAILDSYKDKLPKLACDLRDDKADAIYQFWFDIAPKHLGLRPDAVSKSNAPGIDKICAALAAYPARRRVLASASERNDGGLFLIDPDDLHDRQEKVLGAWEAAVQAEAKAKVNFDLRPDDAATLKARLAKLAADESSAIAKVLKPPA